MLHPAPKIQLWSAGKVPAAHAEDVHLAFVFGYVVAANGTAAQEGSYGPPLLTTCWGGVYPRISTIFM